MTRNRLLSTCAIGYLLLDLLHFADHVRQGRLPSAPVNFAGTLALIVAILVTLLVLRAHPLAAVAAALFGFLDAVGVLAAHMLPTWGFLSDSYTSLKVDSLSWASAWALVIGALALGLAGTASLFRRERAGDASRVGLASSSGQRSSP